MINNQQVQEILPEHCNWIHLVHMLYATQGPQDPSQKGKAHIQQNLQVTKS